MQIQINQNRKELKSHGTFEFPVMLSRENLFSYERSSFFWHWHPEIEITLVLEGEMVYQVESQTYHLKAGDGLFCNSNRLHTGHLYNEEDCVYISITFNPKMIYGFETSAIQTKYVTPLLANSQLSSIHLTTEIPWQAAVLNQLQTIINLYREPTLTYELEMQLNLIQLWIQIYQNTDPDTRGAASNIHEQERLHEMLCYIHDHYQDKLTLDDLATQVNICKSECCRFFKRHMNESIFDYILHYRIEKSLPLLAQTTKSVTDIASATGFSNPCYFTKTFKEHVGCTPREYRKGVDRN